VPDDLALALAKHRLEQAKECLQSAKSEIDAGFYKTAANRSYYCIFHAMRSVMALERYDAKKHSSIISVFRQKYIKTGIFPDRFSDYIRDAFDVRSKSDYEDFFVIPKNDVAIQVENAGVFLKSVEGYINSIAND